MFLVKFFVDEKMEEEEELEDIGWQENLGHDIQRVIKSENSITLNIICVFVLFASSRMIFCSKFFM